MMQAPKTPQAPKVPQAPKTLQAPQSTKAPQPAKTPHTPQVAQSAKTTANAAAPAKNAVEQTPKDACVGVGGAAGCRCHHKETPRSAELQADLQKRLNRAIGQLNGVKAMLDDNRYCGDVLTQLSAAESAVHSISAIMLQNHLETCVVEQIERGNTEIIDEAMQLIKKFARS